FSSGPHFSRAYRTFVGVTPREDRNQRRGGSAFETTFTPVERG
ncbi:AraC family transcriptional regulator, partial [Pseudomonas aeruginosa]